MGYRTVVILNNDANWSSDEKLGQKIFRAASLLREGSVGESEIVGSGATGYNSHGRVIQCAHADVQTLVVIDSLAAGELASSSWRPNQTQAEVELKLLEEAAGKLGYKLTKIE